MRATYESVEQALEHTSEQLPDALESIRQLTEVNHLRTALRPDGTMPDDVRADTLTNLTSMVYEIGMQSGVCTTYNAVEQRTVADRTERVITWMGRSAVENALSGYNFHFSEAAKARVAVEVDEAYFAQETLTPGKAQVFISPKMTRSDASEEIAKAEHLHDDDAVRVSYAVTNSRGEVIARKMQSLLVSDIPLEAWTSMLADPHNPFGKAIVLAGATSALAVMNVFKELTTNEVNVPEGPITLVAATIPYIADPVARRKVLEQVDSFRQGQAAYQKEAAYQAEQWFAFELEQAKSLQSGFATPAIKQFIASLQHQWSADDLGVIQQHYAGSEYHMTESLAVLLEKAKKYLVGVEAGTAVNERRVTQQLSAAELQHMQTNQQFIRTLEQSGVHSLQLALLRSQHMQSLASKNLSVGGGCAGSVSGTFGKSKDGLADSTSETEHSELGSADSPGEGQESKANWKWKTGVCRIESCHTRPGQTKVGPCDICESCQHKFDRGIDPTKTPMVIKRVPSVVFDGTLKGLFGIGLSLDKHKRMRVYSIPLSTSVRGSE